MSQTSIQFVFRVGETATDAASVVLRDPTGAFGLRRLDTGAAVLAAGTVLPRTAVGTYALTFTDPALGLTYNYWVEAVYQGATYRFERNQSPPPASRRAYLSVSEADDLATVLPGLTSWRAATTTAKSQALELASSDIDAAGPWQGRRYDREQLLEFPRVGYEEGATVGGVLMPAPVWARYSIVWDIEGEDVVVPLDVRRAALYQADSILDPSRQTRLDAQHDRLASQTVGSISESYFPPATVAESANILSQRAAALLAKYRLRSGRLL